MIAVTHIEGTVISMHTYDDGRSIVAQVSPDSGQGYDYRQTFTIYSDARAAYQTLVMTAVDEHRPATPDVPPDNYAEQQRIKQRAMQDAAHQLPARLFSERVQEAAVRRWLQDRADAYRESAAIWERQ